MPQVKTPTGDASREAIDSLRGYVYQVYQTALAWTELKDDEFLFLEVAEDYAIVAQEALKAVQVKETKGRVTINSEGIVASIDSFVELRASNPSLNVTLRHLTTSTIGKEKRIDERVGDKPTLDAWRSLAKTGDLTELRRVLSNSKLSQQTKGFIENLDDNDFRESFLRKIHFDCGAIETRFLARQVNSRVLKLLLNRGGLHSHAQACTASIMLEVLRLSTKPNRNERFVDRNDLEKLLEAATHVTLNQAQFEAHNQLMTKALLASFPPGKKLSSDHLTRPSPVSETPLPKALANRAEQIHKLQQTLETFGFCWISGSAGMGKTVAARILAHTNGGNWASINLRNQSREQVAQILLQSAESIREFGLQGLIVDDLQWAAEPSVHDSLCYLFFSAQRSDVLLVLNSSDLPTNEFLFAIDATAGVAHAMSEFSEDDILEILVKCRVSDANWAKYAHLVSGGGHPQLAMAFIQSMAASGWNTSEFRTLDALLLGSPVIEDVRKRTRERLLNDLPHNSRQLLERISLKTNGFSRELALDLGKIEPIISDAGIILETLIGSWVDQQEGDRFSLSPLLLGLAAKTLGSDERKKFESAIADSLTKKRSLDVIDMNSALMAALISENDAVLLKLCIAVIGSDFSKLEILAPHLTMFTLFRKDRVAYPSNTSLSHMLRGAQVLLLNQESEAPTEIQDALRCFAEEAENVQHVEMRATMNLLIYSKILLQKSKAGLVREFTTILDKLDHLLESGVIPDETLKGTREVEKDGGRLIGFLFINQARQLAKIDDLHVVFDYLDGTSPGLRSRLLASFNHDGFEVDMLVSGAFVHEHQQGTIDSSAHHATFARLEEQAVKWNETDLAICCRKYQAIIIDEYGKDTEGALAVLEEGLSKFGQTNSELVRAKAKVLYRSDDHKGSLELSRALIEGNAPLNEIEKAFLGRDAAISAEKQGDMKTARRYYLFGSEAAKKSKASDMVAMRVGLLADAALASWHDGDKQTCLQDFVAVLVELNQFEPQESLRAAHCHSVVRHALLWLDQDASGKKHILEDGDEAKLYPGCVSNPEPHAEIAERYIPPIEMAWYMLATVENNSVVDAGITENLQRFLPRGAVLEGQLILIPAKMHKALTRCDAKLFVAALSESISYFAFASASGSQAGGLDIRNVTYGSFPPPTKEQQESLRDLTETFVLMYCAIGVFRSDFGSIAALHLEMPRASGFSIRSALLDRLKCEGPVEDFTTNFASLISTFDNGSGEVLNGSPRQVFEIAFNALQIAQQTKNYRLVAEALLPWLLQRWAFIWEHQRFLLSRPSLHEETIGSVINRESNSKCEKAVEVLSAILPTLGIGNQGELARILSGLPTK